MIYQLVVMIALLVRFIGFDSSHDGIQQTLEKISTAREAGCCIVVGCFDRPDRH